MTIEQLPFPKLPAKGSSQQINYTTPDFVILSDISQPGLLTIPKGTEIKLQTFRDYGVVTLPESYLRRVWRY